MAFQLVNFNSIIQSINNKINNLLCRVRLLENAESGGGGAASIVTITTEEATYDYDVESGKFLIAWELTGDTDQTASLGTTALGSELGGPQVLPANTTWVNAGANLPSTPAQTIYFSGLTGTNVIKLWLLG